MPTLDDVEREIERRKLIREIGGMVGTPPPQTDLMGPLPEQAGPRQPEPQGWLRQQINPGGLASPENVGIMGGGMMGATLGSPLGPLGTVGGGLIGAGLGAIGGRISEWINPTERPDSLREALSQAGDASQRGLMSQMLGDAGGALVNKVAAPLASRMTSRRLAQAAAAKQLGIRESAGQITGSPKLQQVEGVIPRTPLTAGVTEKFLAGQGDDIERALGNVTQAIAPGKALDLQEVGMNVAPLVDRQAQMQAWFAQQQDQLAQNELRNFIEAVSPGAEKSMQEAGRLQYGTIRANYFHAKAQGNKLYDAAFAITKGQKYPLEPFKQALGEVTGEEQGLGALGTGMVSKGRSVLSANAGPDTQIVAQLQERYGIPEKVARAMTYVDDNGMLRAVMPDEMASVNVMNKVRSKLGKIAHDSEKRGGFGVDPEGRAALILANGMQRSMEQIPEWSQMAPLKEAADKFYAAEVAGIFKNPRVMHTIQQFQREGKYDQIIPLLYGRYKSVGPLRTYKKAVGQDAFDASTAVWGNDLLTKATDPHTGAVNVSQIAQELTAKNYSPDYLREVFGDQAETLQQILQTWRDGEAIHSQMRPPPIFGAMAQQAQRGEYEKMIPSVMGPNKSLQPLQDFQNLVGPELSQQAAGAQMRNILLNRTGNAQEGGTSLNRALTAMGPQQYQPRFLEQMLGDQAAPVETLRGVLQSIQGGHLAGGNPSGSARVAMGYLQLTTIVGLAGQMIATGNIDPAKLGAESLAIMSPQLLGRMLFSPTGIRWLSTGLHPGRSFQELVHAATQLATLSQMPSAAERVQLKQEALAAH